MCGKNGGGERVGSGSWWRVECSQTAGLDTHTCQHWNSMSLN